MAIQHTVVFRLAHEQGSAAESEFLDQAAYDAYNTHPAHLSFVETLWVPQVTSFQEYDFVAL